MRMNNSREESMEDQFLPTDVMLEILSRVPTRSVGQLRSVSKQYYQLLNQPSFIKNHLTRHVSFKLLLRTNYDDYGQDLSRFIYYPLHTNSLTGGDYSKDEIVVSSGALIGSCNGLFCKFNHEDQPSLWNPTTKKVTCLPKLNEDVKFDQSDKSNVCFSHYGFGYDVLHDDYKIVCLICVSKKGNGPNGNKSETPVTTATYIYSHRRGSWKEIQPFLPPHCIRFGYPNSQFVQGKHHWLAYACQDEHGRKQSPFIVSLDLATERYGTVPLPPTTHPGDDLNVCALGGELCFYINSTCVYKRGFEMWTMREYGVEQSWFQLLTIPLTNLQFCESIYLHRNCVPIFLMQSGEILFSVKEYFKNSVYLYNPKTCDFIIVNPDEYGHGFSGRIFVETLVEPAQQ